MTPRQRHLILAGGGLAVVALLVMGIVLVWPDSPTPAAAGDEATPTAQAGPTPAEVVDKFLRAFRTRDAPSAGALTDDPVAAAAKLTEVWQGLGAPEIKAERDRKSVV